jgi:hypothetical protein
VLGLAPGDAPGRGADVEFAPGGAATGALARDGMGAAGAAAGCAAAGTELVADAAAGTGAGRAAGAIGRCAGPAELPAEGIIGRGGKSMGRAPAGAGTAGADGRLAAVPPVPVGALRGGKVLTAGGVTRLDG